MTFKESIPKPGFFIERIWIWLTGIALTTLGAILAAVLTPIGAWAWFMMNLPASMDRMQQSIDVLATAVNRATGEDRVIRQPPGLSYVTEPVYQGENVVMIMVAERTALGKDCRLTEWIPLFTDNNGIQVPGSPAQAGPVRRQIGTGQQRLRVEMIPPATLEPGRIELYLSLAYLCAGQAVFDRTDPVVFSLREGPRPG